jgi:hypothetical protein
MNDEQEGCDLRYCTAGLANEKTLHIEAGEENISVTRSRPTHANRPSHHKVQAEKKGKNFRRTSRKLEKEVSSYRPDLKVSCTFPAWTPFVWHMWGDAAPACRHAHPGVCHHCTPSDICVSIRQTNFMIVIAG